jgi:hypothetical protein
MVLEGHSKRRVREGEVLLYSERKCGRVIPPPPPVGVTQQFCRRLSFPGSLDWGRMSRHFENGVLEITIPKARAAT